LHHNKNSKKLQAAVCALSWCYPFKNVMKKRSIFFDEGVKVFIWKNCWNRFLAENLLPAKPLAKS